MMYMMIDIFNLKNNNKYFVKPRFLTFLWRKRILVCKKYSAGANYQNIDF